MEFTADQIETAKTLMAVAAQRGLPSDRAHTFAVQRIQARTKLTVAEVEELMLQAVATPDPEPETAPETGETRRMSDKVDDAAAETPEPPTRTAAAKKKAAAKK